MFQRQRCQSRTTKNTEAKGSRKVRNFFGLMVIASIKDSCETRGLVLVGQAKDFFNQLDGMTG